MKTLLSLLVCGACMMLTSCVTTGGLGDAVISFNNDPVTGNWVEVTIPNAPADGVKAVSWNLKAKRAYYVTADGVRHNAKITGGGASLSGGTVVLHLEGGGKIVVDTRTGKLETSAPVAPPDAPGK